jgi:hypothetical protein
MRVYSMFDPGGASIDTFSSAWSSSGKNPNPTFMNCGTTGTSIIGIAIPTSTDTSLVYHRTEWASNTTAATTPASTAANPGIPFVGSAKEPRNVPIAMIAIAARWSSAHAITRL